MSATYRYDGFISYPFAHRRQAARIQRCIEKYPLPGGSSDGSPPLKLFLDTTDIRGGDLPTELLGALESSRSLIACCSRAAAESDWVKEECQAFLEQDPERPVFLILLKGQPPATVPLPLRGSERRYSDLRKGWVLGRWMRPSAKIELVRTIAGIAGVELRTLIRWDRRRRRRQASISTVVAVLLGLAILFFPYNATRQLPVPVEAAGRRALEFCDVQDEQLVLAAREEMGDRNYVALFSPSAPRDPGWEWLDEVEYNPSRRLLHSSALHPHLRARAEAVLPMQELQRRAAQLAEEASVASRDVGGEPIEVRPGMWVGEPAPGLFVGLLSVPEPRLDPSDAGFQDRPSGTAVVAVARDSKPGENGTPSFHIAEIDRLFPPDPKFPEFDRRAAELSGGLAVLALGEEIWIGVPVRRDGIIGGLWKSSDGGASWMRDRISGSIYSLLSDPNRPGRVLLTKAPGAWNAGVRKNGVYKSELLEKTPGQDTWSNVTGIPFDPKSEVQLCGFLPGGTLIVRVKQTLFARGRYSLVRWLFSD